MKVYLIRHGATKGNTEHRYVGTTDEELLLRGRMELEEKLKLWKKEELLENQNENFLKAERLYVSPLKRCRQTAEILYPDRKQIIIEDLRECSFGEFEYRNYQELNGNPYYQKFIDTKGESGFPGGETLASFQDRCVRAFERVIKEEALLMQKEEAVPEHRGPALAFVVHGGTIMAILDKFSVPHRNYYDWQTENGEGFSASVIRDGAGFYLGEIEKLWQ